MSSFTDGIQHFADPDPRFPDLGQTPLLGPDVPALEAPFSQAAAYQLILAADALRYLTLQMCGEKASGHPGGFASSADVYAALLMLGQKNVLTEVGHHAPGYYSALFLDRSLEQMGITTVAELRARFREREGLLGHLSGAVPGVLSPAGPLGQGQHFAMACAHLHPDRPFPVTIGDGGMGEPYVASGLLHFLTAYPERTNVLPVVIWNGFSQEHHSMVATWDTPRMTAYWKTHGFEHAVVIDAKEFDDQNQPGAYVDSTLFGPEARIRFATSVLEQTAGAIKTAMGGTPTVVIFKQLKGSGVHVHGSKAHNLNAGDTLDAPVIAGALGRRALSREAWQTVRANLEHAAGGPAANVAVTETVRDLPDLGKLPLVDHPVGDAKVVPTTAFGLVAAHVGRTDPSFVVTNADGNQASGMMNINEALTIRHPVPDDLYRQGPAGQVYEPLSEDACAGFAASLSLMGGRSLWLSYESFAINGLPIWQTVTQAMAELRHATPATVALFTAGALEQGRNGWTHERPEVEAYFAALMRNGNVFPLFPVDANMVQAAYEWALGRHNCGIPIFASKSPLPVRTTLDQARDAVERGTFVVHGSAGDQADVVFAVAGDMILLPVMEAARRLEQDGRTVRVVSVVNPRRLYRVSDTAARRAAFVDTGFASDAEFDALFSTETLVAVTGGASGILEPVMLRSTAASRRVACWRRGDTVASPQELFVLNGLSADDLVATATGPR